MTIRKAPVLGEGAVKTIYRAVDVAFDRAKARVLGPQSVPKRIGVGFIHELSLPGLFEAAAREEGYPPDVKTLSQILKLASSYMEATRERTKARVVKEVQAFLTDAHHQGISTDVKTVLGGKLTEVFGEAVVSMRRIVETETNTVKNVGILDGIVRISSALGEEDPVVYWVGVLDSSRCEECWRLFTLPDRITPRVWRLSEAGHGYHKKGDDTPKIGGCHPGCRDNLCYLARGYGFVAGRIAYISRDHDEFQRQRE